MSEDGARLKYFAGRDEDWINWTPVFGILAIVVQAFFFDFGLVSWKADGQFLNRLIVNVCFFNAIHVVFPLFVLMGLPAGRQLLVKKLSGSEGKTNRLLLAAGAFTIFAFCFFEIVDFPRLGWVRPTMFWIWSLVPLYHSIKQSGGISIVMTQSALEVATGPSRTSLAAFATRERMLLKLFYAGVMGSSLAKIVHANFDIPRLEVVSVVMAAVALLSACAILIYAHRTPFFKSTNKVIFSIRLLMWPLGIWGTLSAWVMPAVHVQEYLGLLRRFRDRSHSAAPPEVSSTRRFDRLIWAGTVMMVALSVVQYLVAGRPAVSGGFQIWNGLFAGILILQPFLAMSHYALDGLIYRFRDRDIRHTLGSILIGY